MKATSLCHLALGSNLGERHEHLFMARSMLPPGRSSSIYETDPVDCPDGSMPFLNCVIEIEWPATSSASRLLALGKFIETKLGRENEGSRAHHAPRHLDLDILTFGGEQINRPGLVIPHPRMHLRRFVLEPLCELAPSLILPGFTDTIQALRDRLHNSPEAPPRRHPRQWKN